METMYDPIRATPNSEAMMLNAALEPIKISDKSTVTEMVQMMACARTCFLLDTCESRPE